jgi:hypothetical protein
MKRSITLSPDYSRALGWGVLVIFLILVFVMWDRLAVQITLMAILAYLGGVAVMVIRRPQTPTINDLRLLRWGFLPLWLCTQISARLVWFR